MSKSGFSRRGFIKAGAVIATAASLPQLGSTAINQIYAASESDINDALKIIRASDLVNHVLDELKEAKIKYQLTPSAVTLSSVQSNLTGLVLKRIDSPSRRTGADLCITVDMLGERVTFLQVITGACQVDTLIVDSHLFDSRLPPYPEPRDPRGEYKTLPGLVWPQETRYWFFSHPDARKMTADEMIPFGYPPEDDTSDIWMLTGITNAEWSSIEGQLIYRANEASERKPAQSAKKQPEQTRSLKLSY
jgi:hypothetical protein